jgi:hypothetical protein
VQVFTTGLLLFGFFRYGLLTFATSGVVRFLLELGPLTLDFSAWYVESSVLMMVLVLGVAGFGFWVSLSGRSILGDHGVDRVLGDSPAG